MAPHDVERLLDRKLDVCFGHGDQNDDGVLENSDALALAARIIACIGEPMNSPKSHALFDAFENFWQHVSKELGTNKDGQITPLEWRVGLERAFAADPKDFDNGFKPLAQALWNILDRDNDGNVEADEFASFHKAFGTSPANSRISFEHLDTDKDGKLSVEELLTAWQEYYTSEDPDAPGNWLYGDVFGEEIWEGTKVHL